MALGTGLGGSLGVSPETTYGTYVAPARFYEVDKVDLKKVKNVKQGGGLAAGRFAERSTRRHITTRAAAGSIEMEVPNRGFGLILANIMGGAVAPVQQAATPAYLQTHPMADSFGKMFTAQVGVPDLTGNVRPYTYLGCKILSAEFSCGIDELLTVKLDLDARDVSESQGLVAPSYAATLGSYSSQMMGFKWGTFGSEVAVQGVRKVSVKIERPQSTGTRFYANNGGLKSEPIMDGWVKVTGSIETDFIDKTVFADKYASDTSSSLVWEFVGPTISGAFAETFRLTLPATFLNGDTPTLEGPGIVQPTFSFTAQDDPTNGLVSAQYISTDVAV